MVKSPAGTRTISTPLLSIFSADGALAVIVASSVGVWVAVGTSAVGVGESLAVTGTEIGASVDAEIPSVEAAVTVYVSVGAGADSEGRNFVIANPPRTIARRAIPKIPMGFHRALASLG